MGNKKWIWNFNGSGQLICREASNMLRLCALAGLKIAQFATKLSISKNKSVPCGYTDQLKGVRYSEDKFVLLEIDDISKYDISNKVQKKVVLRLQETLDRLAVSALKMTTLLIDPRFINGVIRPGSRFGVIPICVLVSDYMVKNIKPYEGDYYIGLGGQKLIQDIEKDSDFRRWKAYLDAGDVLFPGEVGMFRQTRWIEVLDRTALASEEGIVFGDKALGMMEIETPELRIDGSSISWHGLINFGIKKDRVVYIHKETS